jgi:FAD-binding domain
MLLLIIITSLSPLRHAFYETFKVSHQLFVALFVYGLTLHLVDQDEYGLLKAAIASWVIERVILLIIVLYRNVGKGGTKALVEALPGDAIRVTLTVARPWKFKPGQHLYLYIPSVGLWMNHPFSLAWSEEAENINGEKGLAVTNQDILGMRKTKVSLICRRRKGFTNKLWNKAAESQGGKLNVKAYVEGPYGMFTTSYFYK